MSQAPQYPDIWLELKKELSSKEYGDLVMYYGIILPPKTRKGEEEIIDRLSEVVFYLGECPLFRKLEKTLEELSWLTE